TMLPTVRTNFQNFVFDQYQRWNPRARDEDSLVRIIDIDDESLRQYGQWPWPRQTIARLVQTLAEANPAAICFDVLFSEPDRSGFVKMSRAPHDDGNFASATMAGFNTIGDGDAALTRAIEDRPVTLGEVLVNSDLNGPVPAKAGFTFVGENTTNALT